jgi:hypothetical protein
MCGVKLQHHLHFRSSAVGALWGKTLSGKIFNNMDFILHRKEMVKKVSEHGVKCAWGVVESTF